MIVLLVVLPLACLLIAVASQLGGNGRLPRNGILGIRIPSTMSSGEAWRAGHRAATVPGWVGFGVTTVAAVTLGLTVTTGVAAIIVALTTVATVVWVLVVASRAASATPRLD